MRAVYAIAELLVRYRVKASLITSKDEFAGKAEQQHVSFFRREVKCTEKSC